MRVRATLDSTTPFPQRAPGLAARIAWTLATAPLLSREARKTLRKRLASQFPGPFDITVEGVGFRCYPAENYCDRHMLGRAALPEAGERELLRPLLKTGKVFVDIGANIGTYALWFAAQAAPDARIVALEPHPRTFEKLRFNIAANGAGNVLPLRLAVAGESGTLTLHNDGGGNIGGASLIGQNDAGRNDMVEAMPLGAIAADQGLERIDLLKIDVEGFEDRALLPLFSQAPPGLWPRAILIETVLQGSWESDCLAALAAHGYRIEGSTAQNLLLLRDP